MIGPLPFIVHFRRRSPHFQGIAPMRPEGETMSTDEYEKWRDEQLWDPTRGIHLVH